MSVQDILLQAVKAVGFYCGLIVLMRFAGKRLAGQITTFDLIVLISLGVVLQSATLTPGPLNAMIFLFTVLACHKSLTHACAHSDRLRYALRGKPRPLIKNGLMIQAAMVKEGITRDELLAGLRKLGITDTNTVQLAVLEETGHISAVVNSTLNSESA